MEKMVKRECLFPLNRESKYRVIENTIRVSGLLQEEEKGFICLLKTVDAYSYKEDDVRK